jgi:hypothetical protein
MHTPWLAKPAGKIIGAWLQWIRQTKNFDQVGHSLPLNYNSFFNKILISLKKKYYCKG